jgi:hypothetical protein
MPKFIVSIARDLSEYTDVEIEAASVEEAEALIEAEIESGTFLDRTLSWQDGDDREGPYVINSEEKL